MNQNIVPYQVEEHRLTYRMPKEVDHHTAERLCRELDVLVDAHQVKELILDFKETEFMDSSGVGLMLGRSKTMRFHDGNLFVQNMGKRTESLFHAAGLYKMIQIKED